MAHTLGYSGRRGLFGGLLEDAKFIGLAENMVVSHSSLQSGHDILMKEGPLASTQDKRLALRYYKFGKKNMFLLVLF